MAKLLFNFSEHQPRHFSNWNNLTLQKIKPKRRPVLSAGHSF
nr:MAG TPA: hypothetical protein [Caudoviricetes sp.]